MAKAIMVQGTTSNAGKSFLAAALCRIFRQDGYSVAPFKAQNMALNSFITTEGLEMGRAQVMQAEAAGIAPSVRMNPVLLKPCSDTGSQVIVNGEVIGNMSAVEYFRYKKNLIPTVQKAYESLAAAHDIIVLEGAGSPAEINLKAEDIVNMGMARMAKAPVLLAGDIDRGGVFASLAGTMLLLEPEEKAMVKGLIINKFRGDKEILKPGLGMIEQITGVPVAGVIPMLHLDLDDEDSLSDRLERKTAAGMVDIAVIRLPHLSNFTDFNPLQAIEGVGVRYVSAASTLQNPDLIILPGTKNTMSDLLWLRQSGLEAVIQKHAAAGGAVLGVCGGYQMLGRELHDPQGVEHGGSLAGMGLLPVSTIFETQKVRTQVSGQIGALSGVLQPLSGAHFTGYEIHMGRTDCVHPFAEIAAVNGQTAQKPEGNAVGNVYGTYVHGLFDAAEAARGLIASLCQAKGIAWDQAAVDMDAYKQRQYDLLADGVRQGMDMKLVYQTLEQGI